MKTNELRKKFLEYFQGKGHKIFLSDSLVPDDSTVLFTSAGMNQFKPYFLGERKDVKSATSCQKCLRTADLEKVGQTSYHHTFFEMLGNFSFGDYFKKEAIEFAWGFVTKNLNMESKKLWVSVYNQDEEAYKIWKEHIGIAKERIVKLGEDSNFWPVNAPRLGPNGPCGPCSEIFFDKGERIGCGKENCSPACDCGRFVEFWNLVFTQFNRVAENKLEPLPQKNIDTGMGLERMAAVLQGKDSNFEIDILQPVVASVKELLRATSKDLQTTSLINAIVDHSRAVTFAICDGVYPSNEERGYVVRKIIRKALSNANLIGYKRPFIYKLVTLFAELMLEPYPDISAKRDNIIETIRAEEEKFIPILEQVDEYIASKKKIEAQELFYLYDTKGFPLEAIELSAQKYGTFLSLEGFDRLLKEQQERSRKKSMFDADIFKKGEIDFKEKSEFIGYDYLESDCNLLRLINSLKRDVDSLDEGEEGIVILDKTPFYAESGGQLYDKGYIKAVAGEFAVTEVFKINDAIIHRGKVVKGNIAIGRACGYVDKVRRTALARAHTATHLLQAALRKLLGTHVAQQGSFVDVDRLRFDFTHPKALSDNEIENIENIVNEFIFKGDNVAKRILSYEEAKKEGALAFFKDKYADTVRVISVSDYSKELCAGTHLDSTCEIGTFIIVSESSISSGIRRIEAVVGERAYKEIRLLKKELSSSAALLKCSVLDLSATIEKLQNDLKRQKERSEQFEKETVSLQSKDILQSKKETQGISFLVYTFKNKEFPILLYLCDLLRKQMSFLFIFFVSSNAQNDIFVCSVTEDLVKKGITAAKFVSFSQDDLSLKGGGRESLVQGVVFKKDKDFINRAENALNKFLKQ
ncbi:MAG: alanine--tRNA ligase [Candidatus Omnitrophota bacterium]|nr:alanine--tRNA ligase [Candidatus Omnitrophota bacterium]